MCEGPEVGVLVAPDTSSQSISAVPNFVNQGISPINHNNFEIKPISPIVSASEGSVTPENSVKNVSVE